MRYIILLLLILGLSLPAASQDKSAYEVVKLSDNIYKLTADGGGYDVKVIASIGEDGLLIVDSGKKRPCWRPQRRTFQTCRQYAQNHYQHARAY